MSDVLLPVPTDFVADAVTTCFLGVGDAPPAAGHGVFMATGVLLKLKVMFFVEVTMGTKGLVADATGT